MNNSLFSKFSYHLQRRVHNVRARNFMAFCYRIILPKIKLNKGINFLHINKLDKNIIKDLNNDGFSDLGITLSETQIKKIKTYLKPLKCYENIYDSKTKINLENPNKNVQLGHYKREDLIDIPELVGIANDSKILNIVSSYLGVKPTISNINCWWSFGNREVAKEAQFFHRDLDDVKFVKVFFYLTDVNSQSGPHMFIKRSHKSNKLNQLKRFSDQEVFLKYDKKDILTLESSKGSCFIEDTYGIHKGQLPLTNNRLILQVQYSYLPLHGEKYIPKRSDVINNLSIDKYTNRLLFKY